MKRVLALIRPQGFTLPNGAVRAPDLAWIRKERWEVLSEDEQEEFAPICPVFCRRIAFSYGSP